MNYRVKQFVDLFRYDIPRFIKNVFVYRKALWNTYNFDYSGSLYFMREHLKQLEKCIRNGHHLHGEKQADKVKICVLLLDRILDSTDQYNLDNIGVDFSTKKFKLVHTPKNSEHPRYNTKTYWQVTKAKEEQDWKLLMKLLDKHMRGWWD